MCTRNQGVCDDRTCMNCFPRSVEYWLSGKDMKLLDADPRTISRTSNRNYTWTCNRCHHQWKTCGRYVCSPGHHCPYCSNKILCPCAWCYEKSVAKALLTRTIEILNADAHLITLNNHRIFEWRCKVCLHTWSATPNSTTGRQNAGCAYCKQKRICPCDTCYPRSIAFAMKDRADVEYIDERNPRGVSRCSSLKYKWRCRTCKHEWFALGTNVSGSGSGCPVCINKTQTKVFEYLKTLFSDARNEVGFWWCRNPKTGSSYRYDIVCESSKLIFEIDGPQHFEYVKHFNRKRDLAEIRRIDTLKMFAAATQGYRIIRLCQRHVERNKIDWKAAILDAIKNVSADPQFIAAEPDMYNELIASFMEHCRKVEELTKLIIEIPRRKITV
jgi:very-short-patch-repair endonuclease